MNQRLRDISADIERLALDHLVLGEVQVFPQTQHAACAVLVVASVVILTQAVLGLSGFNKQKHGERVFPVEGLGVCSFHYQ